MACYQPGFYGQRWIALDNWPNFHAGQLTGLLGRMTARVHGTVRAGEPLVVTAWPINVDGKKHFAGSAIFNQKGELIAQAIAVWIGKRAMTEGASPSTT
jgi:acyl-CoA thioesterase FadM